MRDSFFRQLGFAPLSLRDGLRSITFALALTLWAASLGARRPHATQSCRRRGSCARPPAARSEVRTRRWLRARRPHARRPLPDARRDGGRVGAPAQGRRTVPIYARLWRSGRTRFRLLGATW